MEGIIKINDMSKKTKVITSNIQPNPKEAEIWAKINEDGSREVKQYNSSTGKFECCGGSGSGSGEASSIEYLDVRDVDFSEGSNGQYIYALMATYIKLYKIVDGATSSEITFITPYSLSMEYQYNGTLFNEAFIALSIDKSMMVLPAGESELVNVYAYFNSMLGNALDSIPRITKEQFYNLEA